MESLCRCGYLILILHASTLHVMAVDPSVLEELAQHFEKMKAAWFDEAKYPEVECSQAEKDFFKSCHDYKPPEEDDDYYRLDESGELDPEFKPRVRRADGGCERIEVRTATPDQWNRYRLAMNRTYNTRITGQSQYQLFASYHRSTVARGAHFGPGFLPFHREYCRRYEAALQMQDASVCHMFVDWRLDEPLSNPCDSCLFSDDFYGTSNGFLTGFWAHWRGYSPGCEGRISRQCVTGSRGRSYLFSDWSVNNYLQRYRSFQDWCMPLNRDFEYGHGGPHVMLSGTMNDLSCAVNDPIFWGHHSCIDYYWQLARNGETNQNAKVSAYPNWFDIPANHHANDPCRPFDDQGMRNIDGLRLAYDQSISYRNARIPCSSDATCNPAGSMNALWCFNGMCTSKIKIGGQCDNKPNNCCYRESRCTTVPRCFQGRCTC